MVLQVTSLNDVKVYHVTAGKSIPEWIAVQKKRSLKHDAEWRSRIELLQDFEFPETALRLRGTPDGSHLIATGIYKPQVRAYDLSQLSLKWERNMDCEAVQFEILGDDWTKLAFLQADRTLELHSQGGIYYKTRVPRPGRDMTFHRGTCDLLMVGASSDVWRLNLDQGRYLAPFTTPCTGLNVCALNPAHNLAGFGSVDGTVEFWDSRMRNRLASSPVGADTIKFHADVEETPEVTALSFFRDGLTYTVGTSSGHVLLYDLRARAPILTKDHQYGFPIKCLSEHQSGRVISADKKICKIWDKNTGGLFTSVEPPSDINEVHCWGGDSGLLMFALEEPRMHAYYIPQLGSAPRWCVFLDSITEELEEEEAPAIYDDYKFVTRKNLEALALDHLIGTPLLRAYMHGYFIDARLYNKAKAIANPFSYEEYRQKRLEEKVNAQRASRISLERRLPRVNRDLAKRLLESSPGPTDQTDGKDTNQSSNNKADKEKNKTINPLGDERFARLFEDADFEIDTESNEYKLLHPQAAAAKKRADAIKDKFSRVEIDGEDEYKDEREGKESDASTDEDSDDDLMTQVRKRRQQMRAEAKEAKKNSKNMEQHSDDDSKAPAMYELRDGHTVTDVLRTAAASSAQIGKAVVGAKMSFAERLRRQQETTADTARPVVGGMEMRFNVASKKKGDKEKEQAKYDTSRQRRGIQPLGLKRLGGGGPRKFAPKRR